MRSNSTAVPITGAGRVKIPNLSDATGSESSDSDRDTYFNPDSSQALPVDPEWSRSQALFEDAVGDGTYFADPNCEWEEEVEETKHGGS